MSNAQISKDLSKHMLKRHLQMAGDHYDTYKRAGLPIKTFGRDYAAMLFYLLSTFLMQVMKMSPKEAATLLLKDMIDEMERRAAVAKAEGK